jgi:predicted NAD/FAD-dependent oxidoreductase
LVIGAGLAGLACAHALLGEADQALEYLRLELSDPRAATGALERRKQWAREDPDLKSLRGDARFQTLVGP